MTSNAPGASVSVESLRDTFDRTFAEAPRGDVEPHTDLIAVTIAGHSYALRLSDISGLFADRPVRWLPGSVPELLGLVALRGTVLPMYDLRPLLGHPATTLAPRWCVLAAHAPVVLAFEQFDSHVRAPAGAIGSADPGHAARSRCVREIVHTAGLIRSVIHVGSVLETIDVLAHHGRRPKE